MTRTITAIEPTEEDPNLRNIFVDDTFTTTMSVSMISQLHLEIGEEWTEACESNYACHAACDKARSIALQLLSRRSWGVNEITTRLIKRGVEPNIATITTEQLNVDGWLDDRVYASALIRQWTRKEPAGKRWLEHKLREKEIPQAIASDAIDEAYEGKSEQAAAIQLASIRIATMSHLDQLAVRRRVIAALARRGFNSEVASEALRLAQTNEP